MAIKIQVKRGLETNIPALSQAEFGFTTDTNKVFIGDGSSNIEIITNDSTSLDSRYYTEVESDSRFLRSDASSGPDVDNSYNIGDELHRYSNIHSVNFIGNSTFAKYADLAEKYTILENTYSTGNVVVISRNQSADIELSKTIGSNRVVGIISESPAFAMNDELKNGIYIALKGRVPCKVQGPVMKGDVLISNIDGSAITPTDDMDLKPDTKYFAIANENINENVMKLIEVVL